MMKKIILFFVILAIAGLVSCEKEEVMLMRMTVASRWGTCTDPAGAYGHECYIIKEANSDNWRPFDGPIKDFAYEPGYEYDITVYRRDNNYAHMADMPLWSYSLDRVISKVKKDSEGIPDWILEQ